MAWRSLSSQLICEVEKPRNYVDCTKVISHLFDDIKLDDPKDRDELVAKMKEWGEFRDAIFNYSSALEEYIEQLRKDLRDASTKVSAAATAVSGLHETTKTKISKYKNIPLQ